MIRNGFIGDALKMMPMFENVDKEEIDLTPVPEYLDHEVDNVSVPTLPTSSSAPYVKTSKKCACGKAGCPACDAVVDQKVSGAAMGSAGNSLVNTDAEPQFGSIDGGDPSIDDTGDDSVEPMMDSLGVGGGMKPEMKLNEATEAGTIVDEDSLKTAHKNSMANPMNIVDDLFSQFAFKPKKSPKFDTDTTKPMNTVSKEPIKRIPKGW